MRKELDYPTEKTNPESWKHQITRWICLPRQWPDAHLQRVSFNPEIEGVKKYSPPRGITQRSMGIKCLLGFGTGFSISGKLATGAGSSYLVTSSSWRQSGGFWPMMASIPWGPTLPNLSVKSTGLSSSFAQTVKRLLTINFTLPVTGWCTFLDKSESIFNAALVGNKQEATVVLGHKTGFFILLCLWPVWNSPSHHQMLLITRKVISWPTLPDVGSVRALGLVLRVVSESIWVVYSFQLCKIGFHVFTFVLPILNHGVLVQHWIGNEKRCGIFCWVKFEWTSCIYQICKSLNQKNLGGQRILPLGHLPTTREENLRSSSGTGPFMPRVFIFFMLPAHQLRWSLTINQKAKLKRCTYRTNSGVLCSYVRKTMKLPSLAQAGWFDWSFSPPTRIVLAWVVRNHHFRVRSCKDGLNFTLGESASSPFWLFRSVHRYPDQWQWAGRYHQPIRS